MFENDLRRHFVGDVLEVSGGATRVQGYVFVDDGSNHLFVRRESLRTRLFSLVDANLIINILRRDVNLSEVQYKVDKNNHLVSTDEKLFRPDINEFGLLR